MKTSDKSAKNSSNLSAILIMISITIIAVTAIISVAWTVQKSNALKLQLVQLIMQAPEVTGTNKAQLIRTTLSKYSGFHE